MEIELKFYVEYSDEGLYNWFKILKENHIIMLNYEKAYIVDNFGKIKDQVYEIHCKSSIENYLSFKAQYPFGIIV